MKQLWSALSIVTGCLLFTANASAKENSSEALLQEMNQASQSRNYELSFISANTQGIESQRYRHIRLNNSTLAQLLQMDGPWREVVQRGDEISYFEPGLEPFTLNGDYIVDSLPSIVYTNFKLLAPYYDFIPAGRTRIADRLCDVLRVVARDGTRYSYIVWIDTETKLPLRIDLLEQNGDTLLEQFRVISFSVDGGVVEAMSDLEKASLPPVFSVPDNASENLTWHVSWLPEGFKEMSSSRRPLPSVGTSIESRLFSDGLFSFSVNVSEITGALNNGDQLIRSGRRTIHTLHRDKTEITVVGELPAQTAKRIADSVKFGTAP